MLPNRPYIGTQIPNQPFHSPEVPATFDRLFGARVANDQLDPNPTPLPEYAKWERPADWLPLTSPSETEEKFKGLFAVYNTGSNFLALSFEGNYRVDWGDGTVELYGSGDKAQHSYSWSNTPASTQTSNGYRQVVVTVTPQSGSNLTYMSLNEIHDNMGLGSWEYIQAPWLDIALSMPEANSGSSIVFGSDGSMSLSALQKVTIVHSGGATDFGYLLGSNCRNLGEFNLANAPNVEEVYDMFYSCYNLKNVNIGDLPNVYNMEWMFQDCYVLEHVELTGLNSADYFNNIFSNCYSLKSVKMSGLTSTDGALSDLVSSYVDLPNTLSLTLEDLTNLSSLSNVFSDWGWDFKGSVKLTGLENASLDSGFEYNYALESVELSGLGANTTTDAYVLFYDCESLKTVKIDDTGNIEDFSQMFAYCYALEQAPELDTSSALYTYEMFYECYSLQQVPLYDTANVEDMDYMFYNCAALPQVPQFNTESVQYFYNMFDSCYSLQSVPLFNLSSADGNFTYMFNYCYSLQTVPAMNVSSANNFSDTFYYCSSLAAAPLEETSTDISFDGCCLSRNAIVDIFNGLANASAIVDVTNNFGAADLTAEDIAIAEDKGWTVYY